AAVDATLCLGGPLLEPVSDPLAGLRAEFGALGRELARRFSDPRLIFALASGKWAREQREGGHKAGRPKRRACTRLRASNELGAGMPAGHGAGYIDARQRPGDARRRPGAVGASSGYCVI